ncbi:MAG TPA: GNAT family N-acetyltransferase [Firmicutes bacterium]|nr:GNAT family N-acetyltransferase [Bacillota bacterium]
MGLVFKQISKDAELKECVDVIRASFLTVAKEFNLTMENAPTNPAFIKFDALLKMREKGIAMFAVLHADTQIGFVAIKKANEDTYYMEKLAVLPEFRHRGYGRMIMDFVSDFVRKNGGKRIGIGIINENTVLKQWYENYGFREIERKKFQHLPFTVCLMSKEI